MLAFSYVGGGLGINLSNTDFDTSPSVFFDGNGNRNSTSFRSTVTTDAAGVVQYYDIQGVSENASVPTLYTGFNVNRTVTVPTLSIGSSGVSLKYRFITGGASCGSNCGSPVFTEMSDVTIPGGGGNGGGGTIIPPRRQHERAGTSLHPPPRRRPRPHLLPPP